MRPEETTLRELLASMAAKTPTPGGGAAAAVAGALAAALAQMVVNYSIGKKSLAAHDGDLRAALRQLDESRQQLLQLAHADSEAYQKLNELWKLGEADARRQREWTSAVEGAIEPPLAMLHTSLAILQLLRHLEGKTNPQLKSDLAIAAILAEAAAKAAAWNVDINLPLLKDEKRRTTIQATIDRLVGTARDEAQTIENGCRG